MPATNVTAPSKQTTFVIPSLTAANPVLALHGPIIADETQLRFGSHHQE